MKKTKLASLFAITSILAILTACKCPKKCKPDAVSGATPKMKEKKMLLPPKAGDYEVLGSLKGLKKFAVKYDNKFFRGGEPIDESGAESLKKYGIKTIVSITPTDDERAFCRKNGFVLVEIPFEKNPGPSKKDLDLLLNTIKKGKAPFYIHCHGGTHRGGTLGVAYRMYILNWPYEKALVEYGRLGGDLLKDNTMLEAVKAYK